ncbi:MAG: hypothetical protein QM604_04565 [Microbacterium sp.]
MAIVAIAGLGEVVVGLSPEDVSAAHLPGAMVAILGGLTGITLTGAALARHAGWRGLGLWGVGLGAFGLVSAVVGLTLAPVRVFGLFERMAAYPILIWLILTGVTVLRRIRRREPPTGADARAGEAA